MNKYSSTLFCSLEANVTGIKFYEGLVHLQSLCRVEFVIRVLPWIEACRCSNDKSSSSEKAVSADFMSTSPSIVTFPTTQSS